MDLHARRGRNYRGKSGRPPGWRRHVHAAGACHRTEECRHCGVLGGTCSIGSAAQALRESEKRFRDFVETASDWFWETDGELRYKYLSDRYYEATGLSPDSRLGRRRGDFRLDGPDDGDWEAHLADLDARRPFRDFIFAYRDAEGGRRVAKVSGRPVFDGDGAFLGYRGVGRDITAEVDAQKRIAYLALHDPLTGLPNRILLKDRMQEMLAAARRLQRGVAVLSLDLDDFKIVNDTLGHEAGDCFLQETARRLREAVRGWDTVARLGGDEFTVLQSEVRDLDSVKVLAERLIASLSEPFDINGERVHCGASVGISLYPNDGEDADELLRHADLALYRSKSLGRNTCTFFLSSMNEEVRRRRLIEAELREALARDELCLHYQPQIDLRSGEVVGLEALLRWQHPRLGLIAPGSFLNVAERSGLILAIDRWVLQHACREVKAWSEEGLMRRRRLALNISAAQLARSDLLDRLVEVLAETGFSADELEIEITESVLLGDAEAVATTLRAVHALGVSLSLDDFGTGYSSLTYLRRFPVQKLKIDRSFIRNLCSRTDDAAIARAIISLAYNLKLRVVAEGVETREQLDHLRRVGCHEAQGYFIARPMSAQDCLSLLRGRTQEESCRPRRRVGEG